MKPLLINHKIYGRFIITEPVLIELVKSPALERLKGVGQLGAWDLHYLATRPFSRFQHSIGVMLLLRKYGASLEEQTAGLLHDISHTAFSHVADCVFNSQAVQDYQDKKLVQAFDLQGINKILKKYKINPKKILSHKNFPLLEKKLPDLCADRIDYTFQDPVGQKISKINPKNFLNNLIIYNHCWVFTKKVWAKKFGLLNLKINQDLWCNPLQATLYQTLGGAIKLGLENKIITKKDLFTTDQFLINKLKKSKNKEILEKIKLLRNLKVKLVPKSQADLFAQSKPRVVDPYFLKNGKLTRLSTVDKDYKKKTSSWLKQAKKGFYIKILNP